MALDEETKAIRDSLPRHQFYLMYTERVDPNADPAVVHEPYLKEHFAWNFDLEKRGLLFGAGPLRDGDKPWDGSGMFILRAESKAHAREIADTEPYHKRGIRTYRIVPWQMNEGSLSLTVRHASGTFEFS